MDVESLKTFFALAAKGLGLWKQAKELIPPGIERAAADKALAEAEQSLKTAEAKAAEAMGYELCRCTWPPQICLRVDGRDNICQKCGHHAYHRLPQDEGGE